MDVLPATIDLAAEVELVSMTLRELVLRDVLAKLRSRYDHILIDCPPTLGLLTINALAAADRVIIPLQSEYLVTRRLTLLLKTLEKARRVSTVTSGSKASCRPCSTDGRSMPLRSWPSCGPPSRDRSSTR